jgi:hypothetical protein
MQRKRAKLKATEIVTAILKVMKAELNDKGGVRWRNQLDAELGRNVFGSRLGVLGLTMRQESTPVLPRPLPVTRPKLLAAVLDCFGSDSPLADGRPVCLRAPCCIGVDGPVEKLLARRAVEWLQQHRGGLLRASGELSDEKLDDAGRLVKTLSRIVLDALLHVHAAAVASGDGTALLEMHSAIQTLAGKPLRGCGVIFCPAGRVLFARALAGARASLEANADV